MTIELQPALLGVLGAAVVGLIASIVRGAMFNRSEHNVRRHEGRSSFLQAQIGELYSPLLALLQELASYHLVLSERLARLDIAAATDPVADAAAAAAQHRTLCASFAELYFDPRYRQVAALLRDKRHLVAEDRLPENLEVLLRFAVDIEASRAVAQALGEPLDPCADDYIAPVAAALPQVEATLLALRRAYRKHLRSLGRLHLGRA